MIQIIRGERPEPPADGAAFSAGTLVRHCRYGYRGVVVAYDLSCQADESWYQGNRSQPRRDQPWYHVLVDGSVHSTYAAQTSLEADPVPAPVQHPLVQRFFSEFRGSYYVRNGQHWPGS